MYQCLCEKKCFENCIKGNNDDQVCNPISKVQIENRYIFTAKLEEKFVYKWRYMNNETSRWHNITGFYVLSGCKGTFDLLRCFYYYPGHQAPIASMPLKDEMETTGGPPQILTFNEIKQAVERIEGGVIHTPLCESKLSKYMDYNLYLKCESLQYTGSCAERGARNALLAAGEEVTDRGVIVPSNGSLAMGAAYHGASLNIPVTVVLPERTAPSVAQRCSELGADVVLCGDSVEDAAAYARKVQRDSRQFLLRTDDMNVMAGLGSVGVEIVTQLPELDAVIVPVASGGLLAGVLVACKKLKCSCLVYGAECSKVPKMMKALQAGRPIQVPIIPNLADGLNSPIVGSSSFATIRGRLDRMLLVDEVYIAQALISVLERERLVADGAGVCAVAAVMQGLVPELRGKRAVCVLSGGNIDSARLARSIQRGLGASGRLIRFAVPVPDHRSGLLNLAKAISEENAVLKSLVTEQMWVHSDVGTTWANVVVETANEEHAATFKDHLRDLYPSSRFAIVDLEDKHKLSMR